MGHKDPKFTVEEDSEVNGKYFDCYVLFDTQLISYKRINNRIMLADIIDLVDVSRHPSCILIWFIFPLNFVVLLLVCTDELIMIPPPQSELAIFCLVNMSRHLLLILCI